uniref:Dispatched RND transporter family member 3 n=1 Tax=Gadus morhua TaxID=8049 RepID=A0A8C5A688_GADMO
EEEPAVHTALGGPGCSGGPRGCGVWSVVGCVYTRPWASGLVLGLGFLLPCALSAYMFLYCPPLDIDLSYGAFEVHSHFSAQRFDALTAAVKTQLGSWDRERRRRRDEGGDAGEDLRDLLLQTLGRGGGGGPAQGEGNLTGWRQEERRDGGEMSRPREEEEEEGEEGEEEEERDTTGREAADHDGTPADGGGVSPSRRRRLAPGYSYLQSQALWRVELVFVAQGSGQRNIFTPGRLATVHRVERLLMTHPRFTAFCWKPLEALRDLPLGPSYCSPPSSLLSYLFPSERAGKIFYDGMGPDLADIQGALRLAITHPQFYWYVDDSLSPERLSSSLLRSEVHFGAPLPSFSSTQDRPEEQRRRFKEFVVQYASMLAEQSTSEVKVLFGGTELFDDEVRTTFHNDMRLALISGVCIAALVFVLTSFSVFLTFFGLISIGLSCLVALFLYHVVFGVRYLGILNGVAAFVIIGIGVDDVFVFISTFRQASHLEDRVERAVYTVKTAGRATFLTSFTTAAAYAANTFSQIPAVHDFGLFMALIVSCCWLWVSILVPAALCIWSQRVAVREEAWDSGCLSLRVSGTATAASQRCGDTPTQRLDPDSFLVEQDFLIWSMAPVDRLLQLAPLRLLKPPGAYFLVLLLSAGCCCLMRPATHAPLLFRPDTNLQTLLALRSNLSGQGISCPTCSGEPPEHTHNTYLYKSRSLCSSTGPLLTVFVSRLEVRASTPLYRFSLNASTPAPWTAPRPDNGEVSSFQVRGFSSRMTVCVSRVYQPHTSWMLTAGACEPRHGWTPEFSFFASLARQEHSRRLFFAQHRLRPHCSRVCSDPPGCGISSVPEGPTQGTFYSPLPSELVGATKPLSKTLGFNPCSGGVCGPPAVRPLVDTGAMVFVVFGILGVNRTQRTDNHVIGDTGRVILDPDFDIFQEMEHLCKICKAISANKQLVKPGGAQCLPSGNKLSSILPLLHPECQALPEPNLLPGQLSHGAVGMRRGKVLWLSMAFESTTYKGKSSFQTHADFLQWETFVRDLLATLPPSSALRRGFQTCEHWKQIFMEIIGVESALWSLLLSLAICVAAVSVFTAHLLLLLPILLTILGVVCVVVAIMYWLGWELGAVEAISLSILVGSSVDYCLHLVEGFLLAGENLPGTRFGFQRQRRALEAVNHVGVAIVSSAVTTVISTVPLFFCVIVPFAKFGQIVAINTAVSIAFTLTVTVALLACVGPAGFSRPRGAVLKASLAVSTAVALGAGALVLLHYSTAMSRPLGKESR